MVKLAKLEEVTDLREVWGDEAKKFTPWLAEEENLAILSEAVGVDIELEETESPVGNFRTDIYAKEANTDKRIIIENQLEDTNHDHLGKLITYASGKGAEIVIWVVKRARDEHRSAIEWLNNHTDEHANFFLCEVKLYKIGNSDTAVKFDVIEKPNDWQKIQRKATGEIGETENFRYKYWEAFNEYAFKNPAMVKEFHRRKPSYDNWLNYFIGLKGGYIALLALLQKNVICVELYIENDKELFQKLFEKRNEIEAETGLNFEWNELPNKKAAKILIEKKVDDLKNEKDWENQFQWFIENMLVMKRVFKKYA